MGFNFRKSIKLLPGVKINVGKKGVTSVSVGGKGASVNIGKKGTKATVGIPGTGLSYSEKIGKTKSAKTPARTPSPATKGKELPHQKLGTFWGFSACVLFFYFLFKIIAFFK